MSKRQSIISLWIIVPTAGFSDSCLCDAIPHSCWKSELRSAAQGQCLALPAGSVPISWTYIYRSPGDWPSLPSLRVGAQGRLIHMYHPPPPPRPHSPGIILNRYRADHSLSIEKPRFAVKGASGWGFKKAAPWHPGGQREARWRQFRFIFLEQSLECSILAGTDCGLQLRQTAPQRDVSAWSQRRWMLLISWSFASVS